MPCSLIRESARRKIARGRLHLSEVYHPVKNITSTEILTSDGRILARASDIAEIVQYYHHQTGGDRSTKLYFLLREKCASTSEKEIQVMHRLIS